jgi:hypothetical protein
MKVDREIAAYSDLVRAEIVAHHLRLFGFAATRASGDGNPIVFDNPRRDDVSTVEGLLAKGIPIVAVLSQAEFATAFDVSIVEKLGETPALFRNAPATFEKLRRLRTLHHYTAYKATTGIPVVEDAQGRKIWLYQPVGTAGIFFVGTDLPSDLVRYRQGDPLAALNRPTEPKWGIPGERPNYLFDAQLAGEDPNERHADWWCETLADALTKLCGVRRRPMLPNGAPGAIVVTGDDDQAYLVRYEQQREALGSLPITYFLHPLTKHDETSLQKLKLDRRVELGLHPDALDNPNHYAELFSEQAKWFKRLTGADARLVRNHGFLNDGYWGHARSWIEHGITGSSNLPGFDGQILNGSLLPARLLLDDGLTDHWSILTAIGDGVVFVHGWDDHESADCILRLADRIRESGIPGVIVLNLHPENIEKTGGMHEAVRKIAESGFVSWTLGECLDWFRERDLKPSVLARRDEFPGAEASEVERRSGPGFVQKLVDLLRQR